MFDTTIIPNHANLTFYPDLSHNDWITMRMTGIGGTDVSAILGLNPWYTPLSVAQSKRGHGEEKADSWAMQFGRHNESLILESWARSFGCDLFRGVPFIVDTERPWMLASLDGIVRLPDGTLAVVDAKTASCAPWEDEAPDYYALQLLWYMTITGIHQGYIVASFFGKEPVAYPVAWNAETAEAIVARVAAWWQRHVVEGIDPEPTTVDERTSVYLSRLSSKLPAVQATEEQKALAAMIEDVTRQAKEAEDRKKELQARMLEAMVCMGASKIEWPGGSASLVERKGSIGWKDYALSLGGSEEAADAAGLRGSPSKYVMIKTKKEKA